MHQGMNALFCQESNIDTIGIRLCLCPKDEGGGGGIGFLLTTKLPYNFKKFSYRTLFRMFI